MTVKVCSDIQGVPSYKVDAIYAAQGVIEHRLSMLDRQIANLLVEKDQFIRKRLTLVQELQKHFMQANPVGKLPFEHIAEFLSCADICRLSCASWHYNQACYSNNQFLVSHLTSPTSEISEAEALKLVDRLCLPAISTIHLDAKRKGTAVMLNALSRRSGEMSRLVSFAMNVGAESGLILSDLYRFFDGLRPGQLTKVHLSGLRMLSSLGTLLTNQAESIEDFKVDYFVAGHERVVSQSNLPEFPKIQSLVYDVADVTDVSADLLYARLASIQDKASVKRIYLPHIQIKGDSAKILEIVRMLRSFTEATQIVLRFHHMPLSVREIVNLREDVKRLPAVCISDHFIVAMDTWAEWWPALREVWTNEEKITGLAVFREQIDFDALGTSATREWLKLTCEQKKVWESAIAPMVQELYRNAPLPPATPTSA